MEHEEQYLTHIDYALWEVIVNGDAPAIASASTEGPIPLKTAEQKIARKNELKAKSTLLLAIPDEHLLKFHGIKDAKSLWEAIKTRFGGNKEFKKMFQKLISQLEIQGEVISQEDANLKLLRSLPPAWNNIALIMRNKPELDELSMDDLYNNLKVYEAKIKSQSSLNSNSQNVAFVSSDNTSSTNEAVNTAFDVSTASTQGQASSSTYADDVMFSFFVNQSKSPLLDNEDIEQIDSDDIEEMDLKWLMAMLTMRIKRFMKKTRRNLNLNGKEAVGLDMIKVECYNCHKKCHFARDCRAPRNQGNRNGDNARRVVPVETSANALVHQVLHVLTLHTCLKNCLKSFKALQKQYDQQREALSKSSLEIICYQIGLESLEAMIVVHEKNELVYEENIAFLNYDVQVKDISIKNLKNQLEEALKEKDDLKLKLENFEKSSKNLTKLINSQISVKDKTRLGFDSYVNESEVLDNVVDSHECDQVNDRFKKSEGYHAVPPPYTGNFKPARADLSFAGLDDSVYKSKVSETIISVPNVETTASKTSKDSLEKPKTVRPSAPIIKDWKSDSEDENMFVPKEVTKTVKSSFEKIEFVNARNSTIEKPRNFSQNPRDNKRNKNGFEFTKKACFGTDQREVRQVWNNEMRVNHQNFSKRDFSPTSVLTKSGIVPISAARQSSSRAATPVSATRPINTATPKPFMNVARPRPNAFHKTHSPSRTPFNQQTALKNRNLNDRVNTAKGNPQYSLQDQGIFDSGCSRHMTGNKFYLSDYQDIDGGFVAFRGSSKGGKITRKGEIRTGKLDFEDVYFVKELKFNLFSISQICDKKNNVLFTETDCLVLSPDFKLLDESQVLLKIPRQNNIYSFDLKNVVPSGDLTCRKPALIFMRPFGCPVTILNTLDRLGTGPNWMFDIDTLTMSMNYQPVFAGNQSNGNAGTKENIDAGQAEMNTVPGPKYVLLPFLTSGSQSLKNSEDEVANDDGKKNGVEDPAKKDDINGPEEATNTNSTNRLNTVSSPVNAVSSSFTIVDLGRARDQRNEFESVFGQDKDANSTYRMLTPVSVVESSYEKLDGSTSINITTPSNADYLTDPLMPDLEDTADLQDTGIFDNAYDDEDVGEEADLNNLETTMNVSPIPITKIYKVHPKEQIIRDINSATRTRRMIKMSEEHAMISYINKQMRTNHKDKALYGLHQAPRAWYDTLSTYLLENGFRRGIIDKTLFIKKDKGDILLVQVYVDDIIFGSTKKSLCTEFESLMHKRFQMSSMGELTFFLGLQVKQKDDGIFISQDKYVADILKNFDFSSVKTASTPLETNKALIKDEEAEDVDVHLYRSMIGLLMYLTASKPDIMFAVYACARFQVTLKTLHLHVVKRIFRYLKGQPKLGLWYPRDSSFDLKAFLDSDYARASLDRKSTTRGCQFLSKRLISWQCKKQTIVSNLTTEAEYVAAANCCGQVLWI
ncbi:ribonuclease H-like domain-containing protein [Tanacetum coccineum]